MKIKRLNLWSWMINYAKGCQGLYLHPHFQMLFEREYPYMEKRHAFIEQTNLPDGSYLKGKDCFFVVNGHAYKQDSESFLYELEFLNSMERLPSGRLLVTLAKTEKSIYGRVNKKTKTMLSGYARWRQTLQSKAQSNRRIKEMRARVLRKNHV